MHHVCWWKCKWMIPSDTAVNWKCFIRYRTFQQLYNSISQWGVNNNFRTVSPSGVWILLCVSRTISFISNDWTHYYCYIQATWQHTFPLYFLILKYNIGFTNNSLSFFLHFSYVWNVWKMPWKNTFLKYTLFFLCFVFLVYIYFLYYNFCRSI